MIASSRRDFFRAGALTASAALAASAPVPQQPERGFRFCLNTATLQGFKLGIAQLVDLAGQAGYQAIEPWLRELTAYTAAGGSLQDLRKRIADHGLAVESAISFPQWAVDDAAKRAAAIDQVKREMEMVAQIGGKRIAAPPSGINTGAEVSLMQIADRYRALLELGDQTGVTPELEFWGPSANLHRLSEAAFVAVQANHPKACILADVFHLYKGGSGPAGIRLLSGQAIQVLHMNDYPAAPSRETITDRDRVFPGDGVAPLKQILDDVRAINPSAVLSLEVFNPAYWTGDPLETARKGLAKMRISSQTSIPG